MGNSAASKLQEEKIYLKNLGETYPFGDDGIHLLVWIHKKLTSSSSSSSSPLVDIAALCATHPPPSSSGIPNAELPSWKKRLAYRKKLGQMVHLLESKCVLEEKFGGMLMDCIGVQVKKEGEGGENLWWMKTQEGEDDDTSDYYSIHVPSSSSSKQNYTTSAFGDPVGTFLESLASCTGRRGMRSSLQFLFRLCSSNKREKVVNAKVVIELCYRLSLAAAYLATAALGEEQKEKEEAVVPAIDPFLPEDTEDSKIMMKSLVDSLVESAKKQREQFGAGGGFGGGGYDFASTMTTTATSATTSEGKDGDNMMITEQEFLEWAETTAPMLGSALPTFLHRIFFPYNKQFPPGLTPLLLPTLGQPPQPHKKKKKKGKKNDDKQEEEEPQQPSCISQFFDTPLLPQPSYSSLSIFALSITSPKIAAGGSWFRLYSSEADGLSTNRLINSVLGYGGPTLLLVRDKQSHHGVFGAFTSHPWVKESGDFYGNSDCFLYRLCGDSMGVYRTKGGGGEDAKNYMYCNPESRSKGYDELAHGLGFGGTSDRPRLYIDEVLDECVAMEEDLTFESGPLLSSLSSSSSPGRDDNQQKGRFDVDAMEIWGVGGDDVIQNALNVRDEKRLEDIKRIKKAMKGAKGQYLEDLQSGLTGNKMFAHREQMRGRAEGKCAADDSDEEDEEGEEQK